LTAETLLLKGESESDFKALFEALEAKHQPTTPTEETLVADLAMATYADRKKLDDSCRLGLVADSNSNTMALIGRQEARLERSYYKALHELQRLRAQRPAEAEKVADDPELGLVCHSSPQVPLPQAVPPQKPSPQPPPSPAGPLRDINIVNDIS
jgi:hypothetical protein